MNCLNLLNSLGTPTVGKDFGDTQTAEVDQEIKKAAEDGEQPSPANPNVDEVTVTITAKFKLDFATSSHLPFIAEGKKDYMLFTV